MAEKADEDEVRYLSPKSVANKYGGEDLCERANICRRNDYKQISVPLNEYNEGFIDHMINKEPNHSNGLNGKNGQNMGEYEIESLVQSVLDMNDFPSGSSDTKSDDEDIDDVFNEPEMAVNWVPNVFLKPKDFSDEFTERFSSVRDMEDSLYSCLLFSSVKAEAYDSVQKAYSFYKSFLERLKRLQCRDFRLQLFLWPNILKNISISCISSPKSGKTNAYMIPLMNWFDTKEVQDIKDETKLGAIVLCSSTRQTYELAKQAKQWRDPKIPSMEQTLRIVALNSSNYKKHFTSLLNGCDILIATPEPLLRAIESNVIDSSSTRALIIDEADVTLALHGLTIQKIYKNYAQIKSSNKRVIQKNGTVSNPLAFQTMVFAQKWTQEIRWFSKELQNRPTLAFGSYYELSIALKVDCRVRVIEDERDREKALNSLAKNAIDYNQKRIAIVCRNDIEIGYLKHHMKEAIQKIEETKGYTIVVTHKTPHFNLESLRNKWNRFGGLLFITEEAIKIVTGFQSCYSIIHYKLPNNFDDFGERFRLMTKHFKKCKDPFETEKLPPLVNHIVVGPTDSHIPEVISYLNRLKIPIPRELISLCDYNRRPLCLYFSSFGKCRLGATNCPHRHRFNEYDRPLATLPANGQIKIVVTYVMGANQFYFRLKEYRNERHTSGQWSPMEITYEDIRPELNCLRATDYNTVKLVSFETVYGIEIRGQVLRVRVIQVSGEEELQFYEEYDPNDKSEKIELFCIDFGHKLRSRQRKLFELPAKLESLPPFAFKGYLFGIKPIDNEMEWDFRATDKFYQLVDNFRITQITAWILRQIDGVFWLNRFSVQKGLNNAKLKLDSNPMKVLVDNNFVDVNKERLPEVNTDYHRIVSIWHNYRLNTIAYNSCLVDDTTYVVVSDFVSLDHMYVIQEDRVKRLQELEDKWLSELPQLEPITEVTDNQICFYRGTDATNNESYLNRAKVVDIRDDELDVFLVDHGENVLKVDKKDLFRISASHLEVLPFQAIKVSLFGVKQLKPITFDLICELTRDDNDLYLMAIAEKQTYDNDIHTIRLFVSQNKSETQFVALSKLLVDLKYAEFVDGEEDNQLELTINRPFDDPNEEPESDYMLEMEEFMADQLAKDVLKQLGFVDNYPSVESNPSSFNESRVSKTKRRLKAIARNTIQSNDESDDDYEDKNWPLFDKQIIDSTGEFDYEVDPNAKPLGYDPRDHIDENCDHSDEEGILEEEELT